MAALTLYAMNGATLSKELGQEIDDMYVVIAKHSVMGLDDAAIQDIVDCSAEDMATLRDDPIYKMVRAYVAAANANQLAQQSVGWDTVEQLALAGLVKRMEFEKDPNFILKAAAVANRATRRVSNQNVLDPSKTGRTTIVLTERLVNRLNRTGQVEEERTRQLSIHDGSMSRPGFDELDNMLNVRNTPVLPKAVEISTHDGAVDQEALLAEFMRDSKHK